MAEVTPPNRQSIRKKGWDYTTPGFYFVTCNTQANRPLFGTIVNGQMVLNEVGRVAEEEWQRSAVVRSGIELDEFVVMPTHVHGLVRITGDFKAAAPKAKFGQPIAGALGTFVGAYKAAVSRTMNRRGMMRRGMMHHAPSSASAVWHRNYWDVIVRDDQALAAIRRYIRFNPQNYDVVMNVAEPRFLGNKGILELPKLGFLASRGVAAPHGRLPLNAGEAIISGFLSPMERSVFKAGLELRKPMIWVKPWGLDEATHDLSVRRAIDQGCLLVVSPFADTLEAPNMRRAAWCNQYVLSHCNRLVIGQLNPGGMLACILSEADPDMDLVFL